MADIVTCPNCGKRNRVPAKARGVPRCANCHTALPWLTAAGDGDFEEVAGNSTLPVLVDLWAPWCGPCRIVEPGVERAAGSLAGRLKVVKVNVDEAPGPFRTPPPEPVAEFFDTVVLMKVAVAPVTLLTPPPFPDAFPVITALVKVTFPRLPTPPPPTAPIVSTPFRIVIPTNDTLADEFT